MGRSFVVDVGDLQQHPGMQRRVTLVGPVPGVELSSARLPEDADVQLDTVLEAQGAAVVARGTAYAPWVGECRRCLGPTRGELKVELREIFEPDPVEGETFPLGGERLDLAPMLREVLALALPLAPLCGDDCPGPDPDDHPVDGSVEDGAEDEPARDPRWAALDQLKFD
jgi:uncharacterized protein